MIISGIPVNPLDTSNWVGVIGPRKATHKEIVAAQKLVDRLVLKGYVVVSGLANGIDKAAHQMCLDLKGLTVAIVSTPVEERIYPKENHQLANQIRDRGTIIHPFTTPTRENRSEQPSHFQKRLLERNVLLAHLCPTIVAVTDQETIVGGTRYAVKYGYEFGKKIYRLDSNGKWYTDPPFEDCNIDWNMEIDLLNTRVARITM